MVKEDSRLEPGEVLPSMPGGNPYTEEGIDRTLIWWMLSLTPERRLEWLRQLNQVRPDFYVSAQDSAAGDWTDPSCFRRARSVGEEPSLAQ